MATGAMAAVAAPTRVKVAVAQMTAVSSVEANFVTCARLVQVPLLLLTASFPVSEFSGMVEME
jgi:hypothetical protein